MFASRSRATFMLRTFGEDLRGNKLDVLFKSPAESINSNQITFKIEN